jgi:hypothetical protein
MWQAQLKIVVGSAEHSPYLQALEGLAHTGLCCFDFPKTHCNITESPDRLIFPFVLKCF